MPINVTYGGIMSKYKAMKQNPEVTSKLNYLFNVIEQLDVVSNSYLEI